MGRALEPMQVIGEVACLGNRVNHAKTFSPVRTGSAGKVFSACSVWKHASGVAPAPTSTGRTSRSKMSANA